MRILQICYGNVPRKNAGNGAELRYWQNTASLFALGHEVHLIVCCAGDVLEPEVRQMLKSIQYIDGSKRSNTPLDAWRALFDDEAVMQFFLPRSVGLGDEISKITAKIRPDLIWADWIGSLVIVPKHFRVIYSHHDFYYKIRLLRKTAKSNGHRRIDWPDKLRLARLKRKELKLCRRADFVVCVSASENEQISSMTKSSIYIPIVGPTILSPNTAFSQTGRVFLFGSLSCTAMRHSVQHLREKIWPMIAEDRSEIEWHHIGKPLEQDSEDWRWVQQNFICHGFVDDLSRAFRMGDACLTPYVEDTGFRTKFVAAAAYGVVNIGYEQTFLCAPEFTAGKDCLIASSPSELANILRNYAGDDDFRRRLGEASRELYQSTFSFEAQLPKYEQVLRQVGGGINRGWPKMGTSNVH